MPVHRHVHDKMGSVYASRVELDTWARGRIFQRRQRTATMPLHHSRCSGATLGESTFVTWRTIVLRMAAVIAVLRLA